MAMGGSDHNNHQALGGSAERAIRMAVRLLAFDSCQEAIHRTAMRLYARQARHAGALRQYQVCVTTLRRALNAEPYRETQRVYRLLLEQREAGSTRLASVPAPNRMSVPSGVVEAPIGVIVVADVRLAGAVQHQGIPGPDIASTDNHFDRPGHACPHRVLEIGVRPVFIADVRTVAAV
jgi:hypothetical protein